MYTQEELIDKINRHIAAIAYPAEPNGLYEPIRYIMSLGGKRIRPLLMLMAYNLFRDDAESILDNAVGLEVCHNFTLLHDDLMDRADLRRGHLTVHKKWNDNTAILSGDAMMIMAYKLFTECKKTNREAIITFNEATLGVCDGQQYDVDFESRNDVREEEYMEMIRLKTSLLLDCALKIGAQLAEADKEDVNNLYLFGEKMGLAFQLQDDLLDVYGDPAVFGKNIGGDILCNKKTFMLIKALQLSDKKNKEELETWIKATEFDPQEKINAVTRIYDSTGIKDICTKKIESLFAEALYHLDLVSVADWKKQGLRTFAKKLLERNS